MRPGPPNRICAGYVLWGSLLLVLVSCASEPTPADWQLNAKGALDRAMQAHLAGDSRVAALEIEQARAQIARTARVDLMGRAELAYCAARLASLDFGACDAFEPLRSDAAEVERAYADFLLGRLDRPSIALLPEHQRAVAERGRNEAQDLLLLRNMADPLSRLVAAAVWLRVGRASDGVMSMAIETASAQGWRRPLLAWLTLQAQRAEQSVDRATQDRAGRRIRMLLDHGGPLR